MSSLCVPLIRMYWFTRGPVLLGAGVVWLWFDAASGESKLALLGSLKLLDMQYCCGWLLCWVDV